jgi:hypothetical protein
LTGRHVVTFCAWALAGPGVAAAQSGPTVFVPRLDDPPRLEEFLDGPPPATRASAFLVLDDFRQREPRDGEPPTQPTRVYLGHDGDALYVVFACDDADPGAIRARMVPREQVEGDDWVHVVLDTFGDGQRAYTLASNPRGVQWDAIWTEQNGMDSSFDALYGTAARVTPRGWVAHFRIPFSSLRFSPAGEPRWRLGLGRGIVRLNEDVFWPRYSTRVAGRLSQAGVLTGLQGVAPGRQVSAIPSMVARRLERVDGPGPGDGLGASSEATLGLDAKVVPRENLVVDVAVNPDFSQIESDEPQVVINERFEVFFPERRPFFLENPDVFQTPLPLVFTRRIGDPRAGLRVTGRSARWSGGALLMDDEAAGRRAAAAGGDDGAAGFAIGRVARSVGRHQIGALVTTRRFDGTTNGVLSLDHRGFAGRSWTLRAQLAASGTSGARGGAGTRGFALDAGVNRAGRSLTWDVRVQDRSPAFDAQAGFVPRTGVRLVEQTLEYLFRPRARGLVSIGPSLFARPVWSHDGRLINRERAVGLRATLTGQTVFETWWNADEETYDSRDAVELARPRTYPRSQLFLGARTSAVRWARLRGEVYLFGDRVNLVQPVGVQPESARWLNASTTLTLQPIGRLRVDATALTTRLRDRRTGAPLFANHILRTRWNWQFTREWSLRAIVQHTRVVADPARTRLRSRRTLNADLLLTYRVNPWTAVFAGVNDNLDDVRTGALDRDARQVFVKLSYLVRR